MVHQQPSKWHIQFWVAGQNRRRLEQFCSPCPNTPSFFTVRLAWAPRCVQAKNGLSSFHVIRIKVLSAAVILLLSFGVLTTEVAERWKSPPRPDAQTFKKNWPSLEKWLTSAVAWARPRCMTKPCRWLHVRFAMSQFSKSPCWLLLQRRFWLVRANLWNSLT